MKLQRFSVLFRNFSKKIVLKIKKIRREGPDEERNSIGDVEAVSQPSPLPEGKGKTTMGTRRTVELLFCKQSG